MNEQEEKDRGVLKEGEICDAQGPYFSCTLSGEDWCDFPSMCPYIKNGVNYQNICPHNKLVRVKGN